MAESVLEVYRPTRCPKCGNKAMWERFVVGEGGTHVVPDDEKEGWQRLVQGDPVAFGCGNDGCDYESHTPDPFYKAARQHEHDAKLEARRPEDERATALAAQLIGRTIMSAKFQVEEGPPGIGGFDIEGLELLLDDGREVELNACGWHDIQSLGVSISEAHDPAS
jgi:hypothetical protein